MDTIIRCYVALSTPGLGCKLDKFEGEEKYHWKKRYDPIHFFTQMVEDYCGVEMEEVDSFPGWGNLNQTWYEGKLWMETSFGPCVPHELEEDAKEIWTEAILSGDLLMEISYLTEDGDTVPHHGPLGKEYIEKLETRQVD